MKQTLLIITALMLVVGCSKEPIEPINIDTLEKTGIIFYDINTGGDSEPYSGPVFSLYYNGKKKAEGFLKNGLEDGKWTFWYANGQMKEEGTYTYPGGEKYVGEWKDGKFNGQGTLTYINGTVEKGIWKDGNIVERQ